jgi:hypothetical protein
VTFTELVSTVASRLNLTSSDALTRIGVNINYRYKRVTSGIGLMPSRRTTVSVASTGGAPDVVLPLEKLEIVYCTAGGRRIVLDEVSFDDWRNRRVFGSRAGDPEVFAIQSMDGDSHTVVIDPVPADALTISADGLQSASTLSGSDVPQFPSSFHDVLVDGAIADEYFKMDNQKLARDFEMRFEQRLGDLRYHIAKSSYLVVAQGTSEQKSPATTRAFLNWYK